MKILVVDDAKIFQDIYKNLLIPEGYTVITASNGLEAMKKLKDNRPDLVLLDLNMPIMDGFKVLQAIKSTPELSDIKVVVLTSRGIPDEIEKAFNLGADSYLVKATAKPKEVIEKIKTILQQK